MKKLYALLLILALAFSSSATGNVSNIYGPRLSIQVATSAHLIDGFRHVAKFGSNPLVTTISTPEDVWEGGGMYQFSANDVYPNIGIADIVSISSSDDGDNQPTLIYCLDSDGYPFSQVAILDGQNRVAITPCWRTHRVENVGVTDYAGNVYVYSGTANTDGVPSGGSVTKAMVSIGNNQTQMAIYTIPRDTVGFLMRAEVGFGFNGNPSTGTDEVHFQFMVRPYGSVFKTKKELSLITSASSQHVDARPFADALPELSDVKITSTSTTESISTWGTFHILLVDSCLLPISLKTSIGM